MPPAPTWSGSPRCTAPRSPRCSIWSMGITQHANGVDNVTAIVNLALARGNVGRKGAGLMPIRGHSGVQGGSEMGAYATAFPGGLAVDEHHAAALVRDLRDPDRVASGHDRRRDGGSRRPRARSRSSTRAAATSSTCCRTRTSCATRSSGSRCACTRTSSCRARCSSTRARPSCCCPACTRYEQPGGGTETTTERRILFSPEIPGPRIGEARSEWEIFADLGRRVRPDRAHLLEFADADAVRDEIAGVVPTYEGVEQLQKLGDAVQWGGTRLCADGVFPTAGRQGEVLGRRAAVAGAAQRHASC